MNVSTRKRANLHLGEDLTPCAGCSRDAGDTTHAGKRGCARETAKAPENRAFSGANMPGMPFIRRWGKISREAAEAAELWRCWRWSPGRLPQALAKVDD